jgi:hypothetical protein
MNLAPASYDKDSKAELADLKRQARCTTSTVGRAVTSTTPPEEAAFLAEFEKIEAASDRSRRGRSSADFIINTAEYSSQQGQLY